MRNVAHNESPASWEGIIPAFINYDLMKYKIAPGDVWLTGSPTMEELPLNVYMGLAVQCYLLIGNLPPAQ